MGEFSSLLIGVPWPPFKFFERAKELVHPFSSFCAPDAVVRAVFQCLTLGPAAVDLQRSRFFKKWVAEAVKLAPAENIFFEFLHADVKAFAKKKEPLLTKAIMEESGFEGASLVNKFLKEGWPMFGVFQKPQSSQPARTLRLCRAPSY